MNKNKILLLILILIPFIALSQSRRSEVYNTLSEIYEISENSSLIIKTSPSSTQMSLIDKGLMPFEIGVYRFESEGDHARLYTATETYYSYDRSLISQYSNEQNQSRQDYVTYLFSQVRTVTYGPVLKNPEGFYYTVVTSFNLE